MALPSILNHDVGRRSTEKLRVASYSTIEKSRSPMSTQDLTYVYFSYRISPDLMRPSTKGRDTPIKGSSLLEDFIRFIVGMHSIATSMPLASSSIAARKSYCLDTVRVCVRELLFWK